MTKRIVSVGDLVVDLVLEVKLPAQIDYHQMSPSLMLEPGGACNTILSARRMGLDVSVLGTIGADFQGQMIRNILDEEGVDTSALLIPSGSTTTTVVALTDITQNGHVFLGHYGEGKTISMTPKAKATLAQADAVFIPGYTMVERRLQPLIEETLATIESHQLQFYFDVGPFLKELPDSQIQNILKLADVLLLTEEEIPFVTQGAKGVDACNHLIDNYPRLLIVLKLGASGCHIMNREVSVTCQGYEVDAIDAVGAGDSFAGAFMWAHLNDLSLYDCGKIANAMGAASVQKAGGGRNVPSCKEVQKILANNDAGIKLPC